MRIPAILATVFVTASLQAAEPEVLDDLYKLTQFASEPDIVTPVGATFDAKGRLLVVEVHTHFPPKDYAGPKHDRIRLIEDTNGDGKADRFRTFYEGTDKTMSLLTGPDGWIYVATRMKIFRIRDTDGDDKADEERQIAWLETEGDYPHNGLCGLSFDNEGRLLFGLGENLGKDYVLISAGGTKLSGGGEGGNIYRCSAAGKGLEKLATGFWNPFGICVDPQNRIFCVGNDPDSMPPCRLMHIVKGGDYGYQFRYGRSGRHPLQAWDGELPGTLPMVAGTGEAPCAVLPYRGQLWVTSWGDYRIERYTLEPRGASFGAKLDVAVQGDENFRPVDFAVAPDGSIFFTDWVDRSYPVHGKGRIWKLSLKSGAPQAPAFPPLSDAEKLAAKLEAQRKPDRFSRLGDPDPFIRNAAIEGFSKSGLVVRLDGDGLDSASTRVGLLEAGRRSGFSGAVRHAALESALLDAAAEVRLYALRWIADEKLNEFLPRVKELAKEKDTTPALFTAAVATVEWLDGGKVANLKNNHRGHYFSNVITEGGYPDSITMMALRSLPPDHESLTTKQLLSLMMNSNPQVRREAIRTLALSGTEESRDLLMQAADQKTHQPQARADALVGLIESERHLPQITQLVAGALKDDDKVKPAAAMASLILRKGEEFRWNPPAPGADAYLKKFEEYGEPDVDSGWRWFFSYGQCSKCHTLQGRGGDTGPDLTFIAKRMDRQRLVQSIIDPSREIAPQYVPWVVELKSGKTLTGIALNREGNNEVFAASDGKITRINTSDIEARHPSRVSVMPDGLASKIGPRVIYDLIGLLEATAANRTD
ncbi:MAG: HEAT repeat domain-containing protein [Planctomycetota bacterium]|nr:HEAT repeat domain-containing protein [Planctomycetota bacterium]MDA1252245.1 HEAT repeat domain-containing protein [Planctomycetota bacterium]